MGSVGITNMEENFRKLKNEIPNTKYPDPKNRAHIRFLGFQFNG